MIDPKSISWWLVVTVAVTVLAYSIIKIFLIAYRHNKATQAHNKRIEKILENGKVTKK